MTASGKRPGKATTNSAGKSAGASSGKPGRPSATPAAGRPATGKPATAKPATAKPATAKPATAKPATAASRPATAARPRTAAERQAKAQELRRGVDRKIRRRQFVIGGVVVVILAAVGTGIGIYVSGRNTTSASGQIIPAAVTGKVTKQLVANQITDTSGIAGALSWNTDGYPAPGTDTKNALEHDHVDGPVSYVVTPPVGGPHSGVWANAGVYTAAIPAERGVHDMEHGAVWITYSPSLPKDQVDALTAFVGRQSMVAETGEGATVAGQANRYVVLSPWAGAALPTPIVLSSWGHQLRVDSASDTRMQTFVDLFRHSQKYTPEVGAAVDGIPTRTGGQPAQFGSAKANPGGSVS